jgi:hypothetical protein
MEMLQGNSLCSYLKQTKMSFFFLSFTKSEIRRSEQVLPGGGNWYQWEGERGGEMVQDGKYSENTVYISYVCKQKNEIC